MKGLLLIVCIVFIASCKSKDKIKVEVEGKQSGWEIKKADSLAPKPSISTKDLEHFGPLRLGQADGETMQALGKPASRSTPVMWEADGRSHENWDYKAQGLVINMSSANPSPTSTRSIVSITAKAPCSLKTTRDIGIGSSYEEVVVAYKGFIDASSSDETLITVGSVYSGILFSIKDKKVETIFLGAAAE
jgi:hypothetical protein